MSEGHKYQDHLIATLIETLHYFNLHKHELENILEIMIPKHVKTFRIWHFTHLHLIYASKNMAQQFLTTTGFLTFI